MEGSDGFLPDPSSSNPRGPFPFEFEFGDIETADVELRLEPMEGGTGRYEILHLHSDVICQSEYFKARLSERWTSRSSHKLPLQLSLDRCKNLQMCTKCLELMYAPQNFLHGSFESVEEAVGVLEVAAQLLFHACVTACMHYLEVVGWSIEEAELVRSCISTFHLEPTEDLARKLSILDTPVDVMKDTIANLIRHGDRDVAEKVMKDNAEPIFASTLGTLNDDILLEELRKGLRTLINGVHNSGRVNFMTITNLQWILDQLDKCQSPEAAFDIILADDPGVVKAITTCVRAYHEFSRSNNNEQVALFLNHMFKILQNGKVIISIKKRVLILMTWLPVLVHLDDDLLDGEVLCNVVKSFPMNNQKIFFDAWIRSQCRLGIFKEAFYCWCGKIRESCKDDNAESSNPKPMERVRKRSSYMQS